MSDAKPGQEVKGVDQEKERGTQVRDPQSNDNPDDGPTMTANPNTDATKPETRPKALGGTGETPNVAENSNPA